MVCLLQRIYYFNKIFRNSTKKNHISLIDNVRPACLPVAEIFKNTDFFQRKIFRTADWSLYESGA